MYLGNRRCGDGLILEVYERGINGQAEVSLQDLLDMILAKRRQLILQLTQPSCDLIAHDIRPCGEGLSELDIDGAQGLDIGHGFGLVA